jgi:hypothetical protein
LNRKRPWTVRQVMETMVGGAGMYRSFLAIPCKERKKPVSSYNPLLFVASKSGHSTPLHLELEGALCPGNGKVSPMDATKFSRF